MATAIGPFESSIHPTQPFVDGLPDTISVADDEDSSSIFPVDDLAVQLETARKELSDFRQHIADKRAALESFDHEIEAIEQQARAAGYDLHATNLEGEAQRLNNRILEIAGEKRMLYPSAQVVSDQRELRKLQVAVIELEEAASSSTKHLDISSIAVVDPSVADYHVASTIDSFVVFLELALQITNDLLFYVLVAPLNLFALSLVQLLHENYTASLLYLVFDIALLIFFYPNIALFQVAFSSLAVYGLEHLVQSIDLGERAFAAMPFEESIGRVMHINMVQDLEKKFGVKLDEQWGNFCSCKKEVITQARHAKVSKRLREIYDLAYTKDNDPTDPTSISHDEFVRTVDILNDGFTKCGPTWEKVTQEALVRFRTKTEPTESVLLKHFENFKLMQLYKASDFLGFEHHFATYVMEASCRILNTNYAESMEDEFIASANMSSFFHAFHLLYTLYMMTDPSAVVSSILSQMSMGNDLGTSEYYFDTLTSYVDNTYREQIEAAASACGMSYEDAVQEFVEKTYYTPKPEIGELAISINEQGLAIVLSHGLGLLSY